MLNHALEKATEVGLLMLSKSTTDPVHCPFALAPSTFPSVLYSEALRLQPLWNRLMAVLLSVPTFIDQLVESLSGSDEFVSRLYELEKRHRSHRQKVPRMGILRSDYLIHSTNELKHVEINTVAAAFGFLSDRVYSLHDTLYSAGSRLARPTASKLIVDALVTACKMGNPMDKPSTIIMVIQPNERNQYDQMGIVEGLNDHGVKTARLTMTELFNFCSLDTNGDLLLSYNNRIYFVPVVYFRSSYRPDDFYSEEVWQARSLLEASNAILCPCLALQLLGMKRMQLVIASPSFPSPDTPHYETIKPIVDLLRPCFMSFLSLETSFEREYACSLVSKSSSEWILKPQREGGGNNIYGASVLPLLLKNSDSLPGYILMERISPPLTNNTLVTDGSLLENVPCVSELGIFGAFITSSDSLFVFEGSAGHILRTKKAGVDEGGVASGFACIDTPLLV